MTSTEEIKEGDPGVGAGTVCQPEAQGSLEAANCTSRTLEPGRHRSMVCPLGHDGLPRAEAITVSQSVTYCAGVTGQSEVSVCPSTARRGLTQ